MMACLFPLAAHAQMAAGHFTDITASAGIHFVHNNGAFGEKYLPESLGPGGAFIDYDNDGYPDILLVNGENWPGHPRTASTLKLYHNNGNGTFTDISAGAGAAITVATAGRGLAIGDLWNDGQISAVISNMNAPPSLLVNQLRSPNHWVGLRTIGTKSNRDGVGARLAVKVGSRMFVDEVRSGSSYDSNSDIRIHFGLGPATKIDWVEVCWPSGLNERFAKIKVDAIQTLKEGSGSRVPEGEKSDKGPRKVVQ